MAKPLRAAVIGMGIGKTHAAKYLELDDVELVGLCDTDGNALKEACDRTGVEQGFTDPEALFEQARPDVVSLCTPPRSHLAITEAAARRGIHLLVEKPMAWSPEDADGMIRACESQGVVLMVGHKKVFAPPLVRLKALLDSDLGPARFAIHRYPHPGVSDKAWFWSEEDGRGPIFENAVHAAYTLRFLLGEPERVCAEGGTFISHQYAPQIDGAVATIRFRNGAVASLGAGMVGIGGLRSEDYYVSTEKGVAEASGPFDNLDTLRYALRDDPSNVMEETFPDSDPFMEEIRHFLECVRSGNTPAVTGEDGKKAIEFCLAIKEAARTGQPVEM